MAGERGVGPHREDELDALHRAEQLRLRARRRRAAGGAAQQQREGALGDLRVRAQQHGVDGLEQPRLRLRPQPREARRERGVERGVAARLAAVHEHAAQQRANRGGVVVHRAGDDGREQPKELGAVRARQARRPLERVVELRERAAVGADVRRSDELRAQRRNGGAADLRRAAGRVGRDVGRDDAERRAHAPLVLGRAVHICRGEG